MRARLEETINEAKIFLAQTLEKESEEYLINLRKLGNTLSSRLGIFNTTEEKLQDIVKTNKEEEEKLAERDEAYIMLPLEAEDLLIQFRENDRQIGECNEKKTQQLSEEKDLEYRKSLEPERIKFERELDKERERLGSFSLKNYSNKMLDGKEKLKWS